MRLVQKPKEETPSLPLWLSRDVPHERELAGELLNQLGREKSLDYLLRLHDLEETRRQKRLRAHFGVFFVLVAATLGCTAAILFSLFQRPPDELRVWLRVCVPLLWMGAAGIHVLNFRLLRGKNKKTRFLSSPVQQNLITQLFDCADSPLLAEPFSRALVYYTGDRDQLYERLADVLPLLPSDPDALTPYARQVLVRRLSPTTVYPYPGEKERAPALKSAILRYFARTGKPGRSRKEKPRADA